MRKIGLSLSLTVFLAATCFAPIFDPGAKGTHKPGEADQARLAQDQLNMKRQGEMVPAPDQLDAAGQPYSTNDGHAARNLADVSARRLDATPSENIKEATSALKKTQEKPKSQLFKGFALLAVLAGAFLSMKVYLDAKVPGPNA